ncbi:hypothetical protein ACJ72_06205 [Emergomyces africanus]|uniref:Uncharacterized protein n=1 Tax=Emergomyces africanus TaxID=1955775 RepID=A0A1B7NRR0_9EURO|nr:hypothetical protein ACJ72_06205 [Emergomyces africanus]
MDLSDNRWSVAGFESAIFQEIEPYYTELDRVSEQALSLLYRNIHNPQVVTGLPLDNDGAWAKKPPRLWQL